MSGDTVALERVDAAARRYERNQLARIFRDWIHEQPFSLCNMSCDTCPDWDMAYELADLALPAPIERKA